MLEYNMVSENTISNNYLNDMFCATLSDGHIALLCPTSYEVELYDFDGETKYKKRREPKSLNTINHLAIPKEYTCSNNYMFLDTDYSYNNSNNYNSLDNNDIKVSEYSKYIKSDSNGNVFTKYNNIPNLRTDRVRLYFVNGYDFSNIYGILMRVMLNQDVANDKFVDLCNFAITKNNAYSLISYLDSPIIMGNDIYDRYIEISLPAIYDLMYNSTNPDFTHDFYRYLNIKRDQTLKLQFSYFMEDDVDIKDIDIPLNMMFMSELPYRPVNCTFTKDSTIKGTIPVNTINSDNLGVYVSECPDMPYIEFYGTWKDKPLTKEIVWKFNKGIILYDTRLVKRPDKYEVDDDYTPEYDMKKWVAMHELKCNFCRDDKVLKTEVYNMSQIFVSDNDPNKFYYRPLIFDEKLGNDVNNIQIVYTMRFVNVDDRVQFVKIGTISLYENISKYYAKGSNLRISDTKPFKIYNRVVENITAPLSDVVTSTQQTKYVKVYYDSSDITLYDNDTNYLPYTYVLNMSQVPKVYKFNIKKSVSSGKYAYMDLSNGLYKLMFRDSNNNVVVIEPTYSSNMNLYLGEIEFEVNDVNINKLMKVNQNDRKMSIVCCGDNGYMSSLYDFSYNI